MKTTQINLGTLAAVNLAASKDQTRFYLHGVFIECRETTVTYVATDGHRMLVVQEELPELAEGDERLTGDFIVPSDKCKGERGQTCTMQQESDGRLTFTDTKQSFRPVDDTFVEWRRVIPGTPEPVTSAQSVARFNMRYLGDFAKFAKAMGWPEKYVQIHYTAPTHPHAITFGEDHPNAFGCLMPLSGAREVWTGAPDWVKQP